MTHTFVSGREAAAESLIAAGGAALGLEGEADLKKVRYGDWRRTAIAWAIWKQTSVSQQWIADRLRMKSAGNVSQQIRRFEMAADRELRKT